MEAVGGDEALTLAVRQRRIIISLALNFDRALALPLALALALAFTFTLSLVSGGFLRLNLSAERSPVIHLQLER